MTRYIVPIVFFIIALLFMGLALHFSRYKKRKTGCGCGGVGAGHTGAPDNHPQESASCRSCPQGD